MFVSIGGTYFDGTSSRTIKALWKSDGTPEGTVIVKAIFTTKLATMNGLLFFITYNDDGSTDLWKSDGTTDGTVVIKHLNSTDPGSHWASMTPICGTLFFAADDGVSGQELWQSDGTPEGTTLIQDIAPGPQGAQILSFALAGDTLFFSADDGSHGRELWALPLRPAISVSTLPVLETYRIFLPWVRRVGLSNMTCTNGIPSLSPAQQGSVTASN